MNISVASAPWWLRALFVIVGYGVWQWTQWLIGERPAPVGEIHDVVLDWLAGPNAYLHAHPHAADLLLISSSAIIDVLGIFLLGLSIIGRSVRPFLGLLLLFGMRQICQGLCALKAPPGLIWYDPGVPSLLVTYKVANDFFFSGHTGLAILGVIEMVRFAGRRWWLLGTLIIAFEALTVLMLRAHYFMDVFTGAVAAAYAAVLAERWAPWCDSVLARLCGGTVSLQDVPFGASIIEPSAITEQIPDSSDETEIIG